MIGQPADSMVDDELIHDMIPPHIPVEMAVAPEHNPLSRHHIVKAPPTSTQGKRHQHTLSPEKLGVVGYVKDVAGFVTDYVQDSRERRRKSKDASSSEQRSGITEPLSPSQESNKQFERRSSTQETAEDEAAARQPKSPLAHAVGQLFPGIHASDQDHACVHADEIRSEMMRSQDTFREGERGLVPK
ncbi:hypothetical protein INT44_001799 [Umbelopsis vinacea]|uniref:Uncharacterized protein n=1 Tax=Umbelopsis vinacea TaxID=44442 RepID=A0A8H7PR95_9FUNG|nr:hypothetical protein INT44_001799 [Umbelopsis vinacea]